MTSPAFTRSPLGDLRELADTALMQTARDLAAERRLIEADQARVAGELARRSARSLGYEGLAVKVGARTVDKLVSTLTGVSVPEARSMVTVGELGHAGFLDAVADAVAAGDVSVAAAAAIKEGLGEPNADVDATQLEGAARKLAGEATSMAPGDAARAARRARDELDAAGAADREAAFRQRRFLRLYAQPDGMTRVSGLLDPESAALVTDAFDRVTMPRRGGPRFVHPSEKAREAAAEGDTRSLEQVTVDAFVQFVVMASGVDDGTVFGVKAPAVRLHARASDVNAEHATGYFEGQSAPVGATSVQRQICTSGVVPVFFAGGQPIDVGREVRPFTARQRIAIAARDGGCMAPGCDRPPSWTEVHHCIEWSRGGTTDLINGISLCRHHHMWVHNTQRRVEHRDGRFWLHPPDGAAPELLPSKHPLHRHDHALTG